MEKQENLKSDIPADYVGDSIMFWEMPYGCEIVSINTGQSLVIESEKDAMKLISSLLQMITVLAKKQAGKK